MRGLRSTLALLVVLGGLGAYIYFVLSKQSDDTASKQEKLFTGVESDKIEELKVKSESGDVTTLKKEGGTWKIVSPVSVPASEGDASGIANVLGTLEIVRVIDDTPTDLKEYGLDPPRIEIEFKSSEGKPSGRLLVGEKTATGGNLYARHDGDNRVVLIGQYQEASLNKSTFDLRDKAIVKFERDKVDGVDVTAGGPTLEFAKAGGDWKITQPIAARADFSAVEGLVGRVETA